MLDTLDSFSPAIEDNDISVGYAHDSSGTSGPALVDAQNSNHQMGTFGTGATRHITTDYSCLQDPTLDTTSVRVGGGRDTRPSESNRQTRRTR